MLCIENELCLLILFMDSWSCSYLGSCQGDLAALLHHFKSVYSYRCSFCLQVPYSGNLKIFILAEFIEFISNDDLWDQWRGGIGAREGPWPPMN